MPAHREETRVEEKDEMKKKNTKIALRLTVFFACLILIDFLVISILYSWADWIALLLFSLLFIVPGYISNAGMVILGGGKPIDGGKNWRDGKRILGDHKTWKGLIFGPLIIGIPISIFLFFLFQVFWSNILEIQVEGAELGHYVIYSDIYYYEYYFIGGTMGFLSIIIRIALCSYGAAIGDLIGSFLKRRFNFDSGEPFWVIDQLDFAIFSIIILSIPAIIFPTIFIVPDINIIIFLILLTPAVSLIANTIAYLFGLKDVPW